MGKVETFGRSMGKVEKFGINLGKIKARGISLAKMIRAFCISRAKVKTKAMMGQKQISLAYGEQIWEN